MAWIYLAASADSLLPWSHGLGPSPTVKATDGLKHSCLAECRTDNCRELPSGMMCKLSEAALFHASILFTAGSPAKTSALRDVVRAWKESEVVFSSRSSDSWKKHAPGSSSSKTCPPYALEDFSKSSKHLPIFGMTAAGRVYLPQKLEPRTLEGDGSSLLPTHTATANMMSPSMQKWPRHRNLWPTLKASDSNPCGMMAMLRYNMRTGRKTLITEVAKSLWPTPTASHGTQGNSRPLSKQVGGQLNPTWCEWLMGYLCEWTVLEDWATQWSRPKRVLRSKDCSALKESER